MWVRRATSAPGELASPQPGVARYMPAPRQQPPVQSANAPAPPETSASVTTPGHAPSPALVLPLPETPEAWAVRVGPEAVVLAAELEERSMHLRSTQTAFDQAAALNVALNERIALQVQAAEVQEAERLEATSQTQILRRYAAQLQLDGDKQQHSATVLKRQIQQIGAARDKGQQALNEMIETSRLVAAPEVALLREDIRQREVTAGELRGEVEDSYAESDQLRKQLSHAHELRVAQERASQEKDERILLLQREVESRHQQESDDPSWSEARGRGSRRKPQPSRVPLFEEPSGSGVPPSNRRESSCSRSPSPMPFRPFQLHVRDDPCEFETLWQGLPRSSAWRLELQQLLDDNLTLLAPKLDPRLDFVDEYLIQPHAAMLIEENISGLEDYPMYNALRMRAKMLQRISARTKPLSTVGDLGKSYANAVTDAKVSAPTSTDDEAPDDDALSQYTDASAFSTALLPLPSVPKDILRNACSDSSVAAIVMSTAAIDHSGIERQRRTFWTTQMHTSRMKHMVKDHRDKIRYARDLADRISIPKDLSSVDPSKSAAAWSSFRSAFVAEVLVALRYGSDWMMVLTTLLNRFMASPSLQQHKAGHGRLLGFIKTAINDTRLHEFPLLHADVLFFKMDMSFEGAVKSSVSTDWDEMRSRIASFDSIILSQSLVAAFVKMKSDEHTTSETVWYNPIDRMKLFERFYECLTHDVGDPARGAANAKEFNVMWLRREAQVVAGNVPASQLDICVFAREVIVPLEIALARDRANGAAPAAQDTRVSEVERPPRAPHRSETRRVAAAATTQHGKQRAAAVARDAAAPAELLDRPIAATALPRDAPGAAPNPSSTPRSSSAQPFSNASANGRPANPPAGKLGEPEGVAWTPELWRRVTVNWDHLETAVVKMDDGAGQVKSWAYAVAAKARPADKTLKVFRNTGRPESTPVTREWAVDACAYCAHRPAATDPAEKNPAHPNAWFFGTGDGKHNPYRCQCFKRFLAEGGDRSHSEREKKFLRDVLVYRERRRE